MCVYYCEMSNRKRARIRLAGAVVMSLVALNTVAQVFASNGTASSSATSSATPNKTSSSPNQSRGQHSFSRPKLVLSIVVDQLRTDYIEYLQELMGEGGFRRLINEGVYMRDVDFGTSGLDPVSASALIYTGAYPNVNGVTGKSHYDPSALRSVQTLYSSGGYSPENLKLSTFADEIGIDSGGLSIIFSIAADPQQAVVMSGHSGSGALRIDQERGNWSLIPYYGSNAQASMLLSRRPALSARLDTMQWAPLLPDLNQYPGIPAQKRYYPFRHIFSTKLRDAYTMFTQSARSNEEITTLAIDVLQTMALGKRDAIDLLNIAYTAAPYKFVKDGDYRLELQDTYLRLDRQLARLLQAVERYVGLDNTVILISSTGYYNDATPVDPKYKIPSGDFSARKAMSLLNSFYSARYGNAEYVQAYENGRFHLNRKLLQQRNISLSEAADAGKDFLKKMSGVAQAYTAEELNTSVLSSLLKLQRITDPNSGGDIIIEVTPGWNLIDDTVVPTVTTPIRLSATETPAFLLAPNLPAETINATVDATALAPTISRILRIRSPNGASSKPVKLNAGK